MLTPFLVLHRCLLCLCQMFMAKEKLADLAMFLQHKFSGAQDAKPAVQPPTAQPAGTTIPSALTAQKTITGDRK